MKIINFFKDVALFTRAITSKIFRGYAKNFKIENPDFILVVRHIHDEGNLILISKESASKNFIWRPLSKDLFGWVAVNGKSLKKTIYQYTPSKLDFNVFEYEGEEFSLLGRNSKEYDDLESFIVYVNDTTPSNEKHLDIINASSDKDMYNFLIERCIEIENMHIVFKMTQK